MIQVRRCARSSERTVRVTRPRSVDDWNARVALPDLFACFSFVTELTGDERYAFIHRDPVIRGDDVCLVEKERDSADPRLGANVLTRIPLAVPFQAGNFPWDAIASPNTLK